MAGLKEICLDNVSKSNFDLIRPNHCQPPQVDEPYLLQHTEDQLDTSILSTDTEGYTTANSECDEADVSDFELEEFIRAENFINSLPDGAVESWPPFVETKIESELIERCDVRSNLQKNSKDSDCSQDNTVRRIAKQSNEKGIAITAKTCSDEPSVPLSERSSSEIHLPERTTDKIIYLDENGHIKRFQSSLNWVPASVVTKDTNKCLDCAAQISTKDMTATELDTTAISMSMLNSATPQTTLLEKSTDAFGPNIPDEKEADLHNDNESDLNDHAFKSFCKSRVSPTYNTSCYKTGCDYKEDHVNSEATDDGSEMVGKVDKIIMRLETLMHRKSPKPTDSVEGPINQSTLSTPVRELTPNSKKEVHHLLQEAADTMDVNGLNLDDSQSSIELVLSIVKEAGKRYGFGEDDWPKKLMIEHNNIGAGDKSPNSEVSPTSATRKAVSYSHSVTTTSHKTQCNSSPILKASKHSSLHISSEKRVAEKTNSVPELLEQNTATVNNGCRHRKKGGDVSTVHFSHAGRYDLGDHGVTHSSQIKGNIVRRHHCHPPQVEDFVTCHQILQETRGVKARIAKKHRRSNTKKRVVQDVPTVDEYKVSTKIGVHSFFEILNAKISIPQTHEKKSMTEATVPIQLHSDAVWTNGEINVLIRDLDRDLSHLPVDTKEQFSRIPKSISIDFVREYKEDRLGQKSPNIIKKTVEERLTATSPVKERQQKTQISPPPFNTKVDYIFKKDPLVLGTLDKKNFSNRKVIQQKKIRKTEIPVFCVV